MRRLFPLMTGLALAGCVQFDTSNAFYADEDGDGVTPADGDCDDQDAALGAVDADADCDGVRTADDCDDGDASSTVVADDGDCDGVLTAEDCDDGDASMPTDDADCDGVLTSDDCDDGDPSSTVLAEDGDCDGVLTSDDCDDGDPSSTVLAEDGDCDGVLTSDDCDDGDAELLAVADDADCDGVLTADDCDDGDASLLAEANDADCDGVLTADDCDDGDASLLAEANDGDCDGVLTSDDCDDGDASSTAVATDGDCDGVLTSDDCDDGDAELLAVADDADCDGALTADDCDDTDPTVYPGAAEVGLGLLEDLACDGGGGSLADADYEFIGENSYDYAGISVSTAGDVDGDGLDDLFVGARGNDDGGTYAGKAYLLLGSSLAASTSSSIDLSRADFDFIGENSGDYAGYSVSTAGDVDGDGLDDLFVGAHRNDDGGTHAGKAYLLLGSSLAASTSSSIDLSRADFDFIGENSGDYAGYSVSTAGDVDGDGLDDLFVGAYRNDDGGTYAGKAYLLLGSSLAASTSSSIDLSRADFEFIGENYSDYAGYSVSTAGDVDGDGLDDLFVGAHQNDDGGTSAGKAYLLLGSSLAASASSSIDLSRADFEFIGENYGDYAGYSVSTAGDVDGDGLDDLFVGAYGNGDGGTSAGKAYLLLGSSLAASASSSIDLSRADFEFIGENYGDHAGISVSTAGDVDGDGLDDLFVGAYHNGDGGTFAGKAYLLLGSSLAASASSSIDLSRADFEFIGENRYDYAGNSVSTAGDVDGDGLDDLFVGAYVNGDGGYRAGKAYLLLSGL